MKQSLPVEDTGEKPDASAFGFQEAMSLVGVVTVGIAFFLNCSISAGLFWLGGASLFFGLLEPVTGIIIAIKSAGAPAPRKPKS